MTLQIQDNTKRTMSVSWQNWRTSTLTNCYTGLYEATQSHSAGFVYDTDGEQCHVT